MGELRFYIGLKASSSPQRYFVKPLWRLYFHFPCLPSLKNWEKAEKKKEWEDSHMTRPWGYSRRSGRFSSTAWKQVGWLVPALCSKSLPTLCDPMDCSPPGSSVRGILQASTLEWVGMPPPGDLPDPGTEPGSLVSPALAGRFFMTRSPWMPALVSLICAWSLWLSLGRTYPEHLVS